MILHIICNPTSGNGAGKSIGEQTAARLRQAGVPCVMRYTNYRFHAIEFAKEAVAAGADTVVAIGGDGTLHEVAQGIIDTPVRYGIIPAGTGNDYIKTLRIPADPDQALDLILKGEAKPVDTVRINDRLFINEAGCGFDVMVLDYAEKAKKVVKGILPYLHGVIQTILHYHDTAVRLQLDEGEIADRKLLVLAVANGRYIGGGIPIAPEAVPDDGKLDVLTVAGMSKARMFSVLPGLLKGKIQTFPETVHCYARKVHLWGRGLRINIDGEILTMDEADIEIKPASLLVCRP